MRDLFKTRELRTGQSKRSYVFFSLLSSVLQTEGTGEGRIILPETRWKMMIKKNTLSAL